MLAAARCAAQLMLAVLPMAALAADAPRFAIFEFEIEGNTVLPVTAVEQAVMPFMGEDRQLSDVEAAREALEKRYQQAGFLTVFVDVPEQRVEGGLVRLRVTEGRVERLRVTGARYYDQGVIRERVDQLAPGRVPDFNAVQRQVASLARDERQVQPLLRPGLTPGTVEAELKVADKLPATATLDINNRHAADTEPWRTSLNLRYNNLWQRDHSVSLTFITAPAAPKQSKVAVVNYSAPLSAQDTLLAYAVWSDSLVEPLGAVTVIGKGITLGARWLRSASSADSLHSVSLGADYKDVRERLTTQRGEVGSDLSTPLRYMPLQAAYTGNWPHTRGQTTLNTSVVVGVRALFQRDVACPGNLGAIDQFACKRNEADGSFAYWRGDLRSSQALAELTGLASLPGSVSLRLGWQLATQPLVSGEQYALGGADTVRGYLEAEASGDQALLGSLEWRSANLLDGKSWLRDLSLLAFVDVARAQTILPQPEQAGRVPLLGSGLGLRLRAAPNLSAEMDIGWPLKATRISPKSEPRMHLRFTAQI